MVIPDVTNPFFPEVVRGAEDIAYRHSYRVVLCNADNDPGKEASYFVELAIGSEARLGRDHWCCCRCAHRTSGQTTSDDGLCTLLGRSVLTGSVWGNATYAVRTAQDPSPMANA